jgi:hypothetical protein
MHQQWVHDQEHLAFVPRRNLGKHPEQRGVFIDGCGKYFSLKGLWRKPVLTSLTAPG